METILLIAMVGLAFFLNPDLDSDVKALIAKSIVGILGCAVAIYSCVVIADRVIMVGKPLIVNFIKLCLRRERYTIKVSPESPSVAFSTAV